LKKLAAFLQLVRWPNLVFILLTQLMYRYCIAGSVGVAFNEGRVPGFLFACIMLASVFIAAAGYIINDYFDLNIDQVNKPEKVIITRALNRRTAIFWHWLLSGSGVVLTGIVSWYTHIYWLMPANFLATVVLWFYSAKFKKSNLTGNILISCLTAWVILVLFFLCYPAVKAVAPRETVAKFIRLSALYAGFSFIISLVREVIKDMEDIEGDRRYGCHTMPIAWGMNAAKVFVAVWLVVLIALLLAVQGYALLQYGWWVSAVYCLLLIVLPLAYILQQLFTAASAAQFHRLSSLVKFVMLTGILSMLFFILYV
jgi:4-hydroxybenzoate polyprenyltransferase